MDCIHAIEETSFADPWKKESVLELFSTKYMICLTALDSKNKAVGYVFMRHVINEGHIYNIAVSKTHRNKGLATQMINALIKESLAENIIGLTLEVRKGNIPAINLYTKLGFVIEGVRKNFYDNPTEDGLIMWIHLPEVNKCFEN